MIDHRARWLGAFHGAAVGDALGVTYEFMAPDEIAPDRFRVEGGGPFGFAPGEVSDDTDLLLAALGAYRERNAFDPERMVGNMLDWLDSDPPDIGNQTRMALMAWEQGRAPAPDEAAQGNGGLMRAAAHALACDDAEMAAASAAIDTRLTHPSGVAADCSAFFAATLSALIDGADIDAAMQSATGITTPFQPYNHASASMAGHCVHSLRLALWAACTADTFERGIDAVIGRAATPTPTPPSPARCSAPGSGGMQSRSIGEMASPIMSGVGSSL